MNEVKPAKNTNKNPGISQGINHMQKKDPPLHKLQDHA